MIRLSIQSPVEKPFFELLGKFLRSKSTLTKSRLKGHILGHTFVKKLVGTNLAFMVIASNLIPSSQNENIISDTSTVKAEVVINTERSVHSPVEEVRVTQGYRFYHRGIDLDGETGDPITPIKNGTVSRVEYSRFGYGFSVYITHDNRMESLYAHLSKIEVKVGQNVTNETKIGEMGSTGRSTGDHLHLEVYQNGKTINPLLVIPV